MTSFMYDMALLSMTLNTITKSVCVIHDGPGSGNKLLLPF
jgi:hypothetical protein